MKKILSSLLMALLFVTGIANTHAAYDPTVGRWLSRDPLPNVEMRAGAGLYEYVQNGPINFNDPSGLISCECSAALQELGAALTDAAKQLAKYNTETDAQGGIPIKRGGIPTGDLTKPGGHAEKATNALRRLEKAINRVIDKCKNDIPPSMMSPDSLLDAIKAIE